MNLARLQQSTLVNLRHSWRPQARHRVWSLVLGIALAFQLPAIESLAQSTALKAPPAELISYWTFDEPQGGTIYDIVGGNHAELLNATRHPGRKQATKALHLDQEGERGVVRKPAGLDFDRSDTFSVAMWIKIDAPPPPGWPTMILSRIDQDSTLRGLSIGLAPGKLALRLSHNPGSAVHVVSKDSLTTGVWHCVVITYDGSSSAKGVKAYVGGRLLELEAMQDNLDGTIVPIGPLEIGGWYYGGWMKDLQFYGQIDEMSVWKGVLNEQQIQLLHRSELHVLSETGLMDVMGLFVLLSGAVAKVTITIRKKMVGA